MLSNYLMIADVPSDWRLKLKETDYLIPFRCTNLKSNLLTPQKGME